MKTLLRIIKSLLRGQLEVVKNRDPNKAIGGR
jgi:hypothetical protein